MADLVKNESAIAKNEKHIPQTGDYYFHNIRGCESIVRLDKAEEQFMKMLDEAHKAYSKDNDYARMNAIADLIVKIKQGLPF